MSDHKTTTMREPTITANASPCGAEGAPLATYYILSIKNGPVGNDLLWWRPGNAGYTVVLESAGVYTQADIDAHPHYNNGVDTLAIPVAEVERRAVRVVPSDDLLALKALGYRAGDTQSPTADK